MKKLVFLTLAAAALMFVACTEKEKDNVAVANPSQREVTYTADTREHTAVLHTDAEWHGLLHNLVDSAFRGRNMTVAIDNIEHKPISTKEVVTYTTMSRDSAEAWIARMTENGYRVAFSFVGHRYRCVAMDYSSFPDDAYLFMPLSEYIIGTWKYEDEWQADRFTFDSDSVFVHCAGVKFKYEVVNDSTVQIFSESWYQEGHGAYMPERISFRRLSMNEMLFCMPMPTCSYLAVIWEEIYVRE
ncbi:MAG: hypothetical protein K6F85_04080 [Bacteroidales bacterium]|nr:hypothetical protein [Bacteroidales bacterium]